MVLNTGIGPKLCYNSVERFLPAAEDEDDGALLDEALRCGAADTRGAPRDDGGLSIQSGHDGILPCSEKSPRTWRWSRRSQLLSAEARTSVVRNRSG